MGDLLLRKYSKILKEMSKDKRKSKRQSKFTVYFNYLTSDDISITKKRKFFKTLVQYQYLQGQRDSDGELNDAISEDSE